MSSEPNLKINYEWKDASSLIFGTRGGVEVFACGSSNACMGLS
jgi:hypothetical protein